LGEADDVVAAYLSASLPTEAQPSAEPTFAPAADRHRYGDGRATIIGADLVNADGRSVREAAPRHRLALRIGFRANSPMSSPIAGFLVRNSRGENIFGSNTAREDHPLLPMSPGDHNSVDFHWSVPDLVPGAYRISLAVSDGNIEGFEVCDYIEDAIDWTAAANPGSHGVASRNRSKGYFQLRCAAVDIYRNQVVNKGGSVV
jgi:hypothetical protein